MQNKELSYRQEFRQLTEKLADPDIFSHNDYPKIAKRHAEVASILDLFDKQHQLETSLQSSKLLVDSSDIELSELAQQEVEELNQKLQDAEKQILIALTPTDPNNEKNVIIEIRAAAGGDESSLFSADLYRMYIRWAEIHKLKTELISESPNEVGGYKDITFQIIGIDAYRQLKFEAGVHRVQRIPTTESQGRIHTSTVTVAVLPEADESDIEINPNDLRVDVFRSGGHGGQSVNTTDSAVRITHLPTGLVISNQDEKSQIKNKAKAMSVLRSRLLQLKIDEEQKQLSEARKKLIGSGDRAEKIRTYNFPQDRITDHRINYSRSNISAALDGNIDDLINNLQSAEQNLLSGEI